LGSTSVPAFFDDLLPELRCAWSGLQETLSHACLAAAEGDLHFENAKIHKLDGGAAIVELKPFVFEGTHRHVSVSEIDVLQAIEIIVANVLQIRVDAAGDFLLAVHRFRYGFVRPQLNGEIVEVMLNGVGLFLAVRIRSRGNQLFMANTAIGNVAMKKHAVANAMEISMPSEIGGRSSEPVQPFHERNVKVVIAQHIVKITIRVRRRQVFDPLYCGVDGSFQRGQSRPAKIEDIAAKNKRLRAGRCVFNFCVMPFRV
jgi:hypothetical protein